MCDRVRVANDTDQIKADSSSRCTLRRLHLVCYFITNHPCATAHCNFTSYFCFPQFRLVRWRNPGLCHRVRLFEFVDHVQIRVNRTVSASLFCASVFGICSIRFTVFAEWRRCSRRRPRLFVCRLLPPQSAARWLWRFRLTVATRGRLIEFASRIRPNQCSCRWFRLVDPLWVVPRYQYSGAPL